MEPRVNAMARRSRPELWVTGIVSAATFWIPLWAPFVPCVTLAAAVFMAWRRTADLSSLLAGFGGGGAGLILFVLLEYLWVV